MVFVNFIKNIVKLFVPYGVVLLYRNRKIIIMTFVGYIKNIVKLLLPYGVILLYRKTRESILFQLHYGKLTKIYNKKGYHQVSNFTIENRYPLIFQYCSDMFNNKTEKLNIMSFGCSIGIECFSLRNYFPEATIIGYDINENNIIRANILNNDDKIKFYSKWEEVSKKEIYDVVFAMAVLTKSRMRVRNCEKIYPFSMFEKQVNLIDFTVKTGGLLVINATNFRFTDTEISKKYESFEVPGFQYKGNSQKYDKSNNKLENQEYNYIIFKKKV